MHARDSRRARNRSASFATATRPVLDSLEPRRLMATAADFTDSTAFGGLDGPTAVEFAPDGRIFVAEKKGLIKVFDNLSDATATIFADLRTNVHNYWDRGLLGMTLDPQFSNGRPYVYVLYTYDGNIGGAAPRYGTVNGDSDNGTSDGSSPASGRLSRLTASGNVAVGGETVLIHDWAQQYPSHSIGDLNFGPDGYLYASSGDGASFGGVDYGQNNVLGDPTNEGGALRAQDIRGGTDSVSLDGAVIRIDPNTGAAAPNNPFSSNLDPNARRIIAYGLRNPYRFTFRPGTNELWIADTGWNTFEELNRITNTTDSKAENFGWPAYEGPNRQSGYDAANLPLLESLYAAGASAHDAPWFSYAHSDKVVPGSSEPTGGSTPTGIAFYTGTAFPSEYQGAMFFADYARKQIYVMYRGADGLPDQSTRQVFRSLNGGAVDLIQGPDGSLYYADLINGRIGRIAYNGTVPTPPTGPQGTGLRGTYFDNMDFTGASINRVDPTVNFNWGEGSPASSLGVDTFSARWTGKIQALESGTYTFRVTGDDGVKLWVNGVVLIDKLIDQAPTAYSNTITLTAGQQYDIRLDYYENSQGASVQLAWARPGQAFETVPTRVLFPASAPTSNQPPVPVIASPSASTTWRVGETINFTGSGSDAEDGALPASALKWTLVLIHGNELDASNTHEHVVQSFSGVAGGSFVAPDHEYPSWLELRLTATDAQGQSTTISRRLNPQTVQVTLASNPGGAALTFGDRSGASPLTRTLLVGSRMQVSAPAQYVKDGLTYSFVGWSDGGAVAHDITVPASALTLTANYALPAAPGAPTSLNAVTISSTQINLTWSDNATNETGYRVERRTGSGAWTQIGIAGVNSPLFLDLALTPGTTYEYRVCAMSAAGDSAYSNIATATTTSAIAAPATPSDFAASNVTTTSLTLTWRDNATNETGYRLQRRLAGGSFAVIATLGAGVTTFNDTGLTPGASYEYRLVAFNAAGDSGAITGTATMQSANTVPTAPGVLNATVLAGPQVRLNWTDTSNNETGFVVQRRYSGWIWGDRATLGANVTTFTDTGLIRGVQYEYRVLARNAKGNSGWSNGVIVDTSATGLPAAPSTLTASITTKPSVRLAWLDTSTTETSFIIQRRLSGKSWADLTSVGANVTSYIDTTSKSAGVYEYRIYARGAAGSSPASNSVSVNLQ